MTVQIHVHGELSADAHNKLLDVLVRIAGMESHQEMQQAADPTKVATCCVSQRNHEHNTSKPKR